MTDVYVLGVATAPAARRRDDVRLEELVYATARAALDDAGVRRAALDNVTFGACDELDGRPISSMLMAAPAGAYQTDEIKVTDSGLSALCLATARHASGDFDLGLVASWCKPSKTDVSVVMNIRSEPFFTRDLGLDDLTTDALFAQAVVREFGISEEELTERVVAGRTRAARNARGVLDPVPSAAAVESGDFLATPVRATHRAEATDGAAGLVLASERWLDRHPGHRPLARIAGIGWASDSYTLDGRRLSGLRSARTAWAAASRMAGPEQPPDLVELECPTVFHESAYVRALGLEDVPVSPSGGVHAQNPLTATGLVHAVEAVLQVSDRAGEVQLAGARRAVAHSCHGFAQQGNVFAIFDRMGEL
ncbi:thiolase C-terminal domain-containing protein [Streptomyces plumbiresistens]|uniref:Thiolase family protein n=1 Tax=Streptomyces plumbiresistens TaxID=511811 RepID=A0ABP7TEP4_9ACTN